ncbi:MAG: 4Fe-4S binding protein [Caldisericia bacterium]|nr:4Fe-4S binding protein [Caldisericia bacterium]
MLRKIIKIDEEKCNGCGQCANACAEGAIKMINGKARLVTDSYCDGLGACIGECPTGAIEIVERDGDEYNGVGNPEVGPHQHHKLQEKHDHDCGCHDHHKHEGRGRNQMPEKLACGCPGSAVKNLAQEKPQQSAKPRKGGISIASSLVNWPVQLMLIPPNAPYLQNADLLIAADCVAYAKGDFHLDLLPDKILTIACPKLDNAQHYLDKLTQMFLVNNISSIEVAYMEVPCCGGLVQIVKQAIADSGKNIPLTLTKISLNGERM